MAIKTNKTKAQSKPGRGVSRATHQRIVKALEAESKKRAREAYLSGFNDAADDEPPYTFSGKPMSRGYRRARTTIRDESGTSQEAAIERSYRQYATNPLAWAISNLRTDYVWSDGSTLRAKNDDVQAVIDAHWNDRVNNWPIKGSQRVRDLGLYGELFIEAFVRPQDGRVRLGAIDASEIDEIITDPENREEIIAIRLKVGGETGGRLLKVIVEDEEGKLRGVITREMAAARRYEANSVMRREGRAWRVVEANRQTDEFRSGWSNVHVRECCHGRAWRVGEAAGTELRDPRSGARLGGKMTLDERGASVNGQEYDGQVFLTQINKTTIGLRGRPDGLALIDWLDRYDQMFFDILEHAALMKDTVWDLSVEGDQTEVDKETTAFLRSTASGRVFGHNPKVALNAQNPDLKGADWASLSDTVLNLISGGSRFPVFMLGSAGDANLATATAQGGPTYRGFKTRQGIVKQLLTDIIRFAIDCAVEAGVLRETVIVNGPGGETEMDELGLPVMKPAREAFTVEMPEISMRDTAGAAVTFANIVNAVVTALTSKLLTPPIAINLIARGAELLGIEIDVQEIVEAYAPPPEAAPGLDQAISAAQQQDVIDQNGQARDQVDLLLQELTAGAADEPKGGGG